MRITSLLTLVLALLLSSCTDQVEKATPQKKSDKITFISNQSDPEVEVIIKRIIRQSMLEPEYIQLKANDTLELDADGKAFFMAGIRATEFDSLVVDKGDVINLNVINKDSLSITSAKNNLDKNLIWLQHYIDSIEHDYSEVFASILQMPNNAEEFQKPIKFWNDYETMYMLIPIHQTIDRNAYNKDRKKFDEGLKNKYLE